MSKRERIILIVLLLVTLLVIGLSYSFYVVTPQQQVIDLMRTERAAAGQTAVREFELTRQAG